MKFAVVLLALVSATLAAPQPKKAFHDNFEDFVNLIDAEVGDELHNIMGSYLAFEEFRNSVGYMQTSSFKNLIYEMEALPEFVAVREFLEGHSVDITYFLDLLNDLLESGERPPKARQAISGTTFNDYIQDCTAIFPKEKLAALYDEKMATDADFKAGIEGLESDEFQNLFDDLFENAVFKAEVQSMANNGIDVGLLYEELIAVFGQK